jgi:hypothetical protein
MDDGTAAKWLILLPDGLWKSSCTSHLRTILVQDKISISYRCFLHVSPGMHNLELAPEEK